MNVIGLLRGYKRYSITSLLLSSPSILRVVLLFVAVFIFGVSDFNDTIVIFAAPTLIVMAFVFVKEYAKISRRMKTMIVPSKEMVTFGMSVFLVSMFTTIIPNIAKVVISHDLGVEMQGYYDVSLGIITLMPLSFAALQFVAVPEATGAKDKKDVLFQRGSVGDLSRALFAFLLFCLVLFYFYAGDLVTLLFSSDYSKGAEYIYILGVGHVFLFVQQFLALVDVSTSKNLKEHKKLIAMTLLLIAIFPFATHYLIQYLGFLGAYLSNTAFFMVYCFLTVYHIKDRSSLVALFKRLDRLVISFLTTFLLIYGLKPDFITGFLMSSAVFIFLIFYTGYLHKSLIQDMFKFKTEI
jgi:O-antigen/teichoic acid export membrane protein